MVKMQLIQPIGANGMQFISLGITGVYDLTPSNPPEYVYTQEGTTAKLFKAPYIQNGSEVKIV